MNPTSTQQAIPEKLFRLTDLFQARRAPIPSSSATHPGKQPPDNYEAVVLRGASKTYRLGSVEVPALHSIDLSLKRGEIAAVWGPSGSGKSTLLNLIGLTDRPTSGTVLLEGVDTNDLGERDAARFRNQRIGYVFQSFNLIPVLNAVENVMLPLQIAGVSTAAARAKAAAILEEVGLADKHRSRPDQLSGGQRQRVAVARALVTEPSLVIADEPTANLDSVTSHRVIELMRNLNASHHITFLISTHDPRMLEHVDRTIELRDGTIIGE